MEQENVSYRINNKGLKGIILALFLAIIVLGSITGIRNCNINECQAAGKVSYELLETKPDQVYTIHITKSNVQYDYTLEFHQAIQELGKKYDIIEKTPINGKVNGPASATLGMIVTVKPIE